MHQASKFAIHFYRAISFTTVLCLASATAIGQEATLLERFMRIRAPGAVDFANDGSMFVLDWPDGITQVHRVAGEIASPSTPMTKITTFPDGCSGYAISPDGSRMIFATSAGGNENTQIFVADLKGDGSVGSITPLLSNPLVKFSLNQWIADGSAFLYRANDDKPNDFHLYRYDFAKGKSTKLLAQEGSWGAEDISADGARVLVTKYASASDSSIFELDVKSGELSDLSHRLAEGTVAQSIVGYMPGESAVLFTSDIEDGTSKLFLRDLKTGMISKPLPALDRFELDAAGMSRDRSLLYTLTNEEGYGVLQLFRLPNFEPVELPKIEPGVVTVRKLEKDYIIYTLSNARTPNISYRYDFRRNDRGSVTPPVARQLTAPDAQGIDLSSFPLPELIKFKSSTDERMIPAFLYLPPNYKPGTPIPFVVNYHGGPEGQSRPGYSNTVQYLLAEGFGVLQPNVRGSSGYGRTYLMLDDYKLRWNSVRDGVDAAEWLVEKGYSQRGMIATYGGSYGGYMSVACLIEDQERVDAGLRKERCFGAGVDVVGITDLKTFLEKTAGYRRKLREVEYGPLSDPEFLATVSPMSRLNKIQVPLFIAHGFNDPRVPVEEAMQVAIALKDAAIAAQDSNRLPQLFIAPDEGHGFAKLDNRLLFMSRMAAFLKQKIGVMAPLPLPSPDGK